MGSALEEMLISHQMKSDLSAQGNAGAEIHGLSDGGDQHNPGIGNLYGQGMGSDPHQSTRDSEFLQVRLLVQGIRHFQSHDSTGIGSGELTFIDDTELISGQETLRTFQGGARDVKNIEILPTSDGQSLPIKTGQPSSHFIHKYPFRLRGRRGRGIRLICVFTPCQLVYDHTRGAAGKEKRQTKYGNIKGK